MTLSNDYLMLCGLVAAVAGALLGATILFVVIALLRGAHLIAQRAGRGPVELVVVRAVRPRRASRRIAHDAAPPLAWSQSLARVALRDLNGS